MKIFSGETGDQELVSFVNEHYSYADLSKADRQVLKDTIATAFHIGGTAHKLWRDFHDTTAFVRRIDDGSGELRPDNVIGSAVVTSHEELQLDYLAYIVVRPEYRHRHQWPWRSDLRPHHGTELLHYVYDVMRNRVSTTHLQKYLMIEPAGEDARDFYFRALPTNEFPVRYDEENHIFSVGYDGLTL